MRRPLILPSARQGRRADPGRVAARARTARRNGSLPAALGYLLLALAFTYPLVLRFTAAIPGDDFDGWQNYWNLWWLKTALIARHVSPFFTDVLYAPTGVELLFHTLSPFNGLVTLPIQLSWGLIPAYNSAVLFSFAAGGLGAYLLARRALGSGRYARPAAWLAGLIYSFAPVHVAHLLGHLNLLSIEWIPFYALYLLRAVDPRPGRALRPLRDGVLATLFLVLCGLCDWHFVLYCALLTAIVTAWRVFAGGNRPWLRHALAVLGRVALPWALCALVLSPLLVPMLIEAAGSSFMVPDPAQSRVLSADLLAFVTPQEFHPLWGAWARASGRVFTASPSEHIVFAGFAALVLAAFGVASARRAQATRARIAPPPALAPAPAPWLLSLAAFFVLALGPALRVAGRTDLLPGGGEVPLPYAWLARAIPFMNITRSPARFDIMVMLVIALLAAAGVQWLWRSGRAGRVAGTLLALAVVFEFWPAPYPVSPPDTPAWYAQLARDPRPGAVLNLPMNWDRPGYLLYQTVHGKPLVTAYISRDDPRTLVERAPVLQHFRHLGPDIIDFDLAEQGEQALSDLGVRWVVLDRYKMPGGLERTYTEGAAALIFGGRPPAYQDERLTVYEVAPPAHPRPYPVLGAGWGAFDAATHSRAFAGRATLTVQAPTAVRARLRVTLAPGSGQLDLPLAGGAYWKTLDLHAGPNEVTLAARAPGARVVVTALALEPAS